MCHLFHNCYVWVNYFWHNYFINLHVSTYILSTFHGVKTRGLEPLLVHWNQLPTSDFSEATKNQTNISSFRPFAGTGKKTSTTLNFERDTVRRICSPKNWLKHVLVDFDGFCSKCYHEKLGGKSKHLEMLVLLFPYSSPSRKIQILRGFNVFTGFWTIGKYQYQKTWGKRVWFWGSNVPEKETT